MRILNSTEQNEFDTPPIFDSHQREKYFDFPKLLLEKAIALDEPIWFFGQLWLFQSNKAFLCAM
jgi:hypothetical protein